jgi:hypothetical protein
MLVFSVLLEAYQKRLLEAEELECFLRRHPFAHFSQTKRRSLPVIFLSFQLPFCSWWSSSWPNFCSVPALFMMFQLLFPCWLPWVTMKVRFPIIFWA